MKENEKDCLNDIKIMTDSELREMHNVLKEAFSGAVKDYNRLGKNVYFNSHTTTAAVENTAILLVKTSVATTAQALLDAEREIHNRQQSKIDLKRKLLSRT